MTAGHESSRAERETLDFAQRIEDLLTGVLGNAPSSYVKDPEYTSRHFGRTVYTISHNGPRGILLRSDGYEVLRLSFSFSCSCDDDKQWLQIEKSSIMLAADQDGIILFHYDFVRDASSLIPSAHININGSNDSATRLMLLCGAGRRGKSRRKEFLEKGNFPTFSDLHLPVGGDRFRPGIEDVLQLAIYEFHIDVVEGWKKVLEKSREQYRERQFKAMVREFPDIAFQTLREEGLVSGEVPTRPMRVENRLRKY